MNRIERFKFLPIYDIFQKKILDFIECNWIRIEAKKRIHSSRIHSKIKYRFIEEEKREGNNLHECFSQIFHDFRGDNESNVIQGRKGNRRGRRETTILQRVRGKVSFLFIPCRFGCVKNEADRKCGGGVDLSWIVWQMSGTIWVVGSNRIAGSFGG